MKTRVVVADYVEPDLDWEARELARRGVEFECHQLFQQPVSKLIAATRDAHVVIVNHVQVTRDVIAGWDCCRLVIRHGTGYDNLDVEALRDAGIAACYIPDYCIDEVAEQAITLLLSLGRRLGRAPAVLRASSTRSQWDFSPLAPVYRLTGKILGIIGCGRIGSRVCEKLRSFGFEFLVCDPYLTPARKAELGIEAVEQERVFREADFITIHTPLTRETRHLVNARTLALMKPTAYLVNTARGSVVDTLALADALRRGAIAGAALDVHETEPIVPENPLLGLDNVIMTPHAAWYSEESSRRIRELILLEIDRFLTGLPPRFSPV